MLDNVSVLPLASFQSIIGAECNPILTIVVSGKLEPGRLQFLVTSFADGAVHDRVLSTIAYLMHLQGTVSPSSTAFSQDMHLIFQAEDVPVSVPSASWEAMTHWNDVSLVPDIYYFSGKGYEATPPHGVAWADRASTIVWRGSTTGQFHQRVEDLETLQRYNLCRIIAQLGPVADVGLNAIVQAADAHQEQLIHDRLVAEGLLKPFLPMADMTRYRYILDVDGNSNSWNFMLKLRLGGCVLRVESDWQQWFSPRLLPWVHYVPIAKDLSDAESRVAWCLDNEDECAAIAERGTAFAENMTFDAEMKMAAATIYGPKPRG